MSEDFTVLKDNSPFEKWFIDDAGKWRLLTIKMLPDSKIEIYLDGLLAGIPKWRDN